MGVLKHLRALGEFLFDQFQHLAEEGAGVADGRALADAGGEGDGVRAALDEQAASTKLDQLSVRRWGEGEDVANLCLFLAGDLSGYITGALLDVSGGKFATQDPGAAWRSL